MSTAQFRGLVRGQFPHATVKVKTVSFADLARGESQCLTTEGTRAASEQQQINQWAQQAGIQPDTSLRFYPQPAAQLATATEDQL